MDPQEQSIFSPGDLLVKATETASWESHNNSQRQQKHCAVPQGLEAPGKWRPTTRFWARTLEDDSLVMEIRKVERLL